MPPRLTHEFLLQDTKQKQTMKNIIRLVLTTLVLTFVSACADTQDEVASGGKTSVPVRH